MKRRSRKWGIEYSYLLSSQVTAHRWKRVREAHTVTQIHSSLSLFPWQNQEREREVKKWLGGKDRWIREAVKICGVLDAEEETSERV